MDFGAIVRILYGTVVPLAQLAGKKADIPIDMALLPRTEAVAKHFFGGIWGLKLEDDGIAFHASTPCGVMPMMVVSMAPLFVLTTGFKDEAEIAVAFPARDMGEGGIAPLEPPVAVEPARPVPERPAGVAEDRLEQIYVALLWHFADKGGYPDDLGALVESGALENAASLLLPGDEAPLATQGGAKSSFLYLGAKVGDLREGRDRAVWVHSRDGLGGDRWVLFADGTRKQVPEAEFEKLLTETKERLAK